MSTMFAMRGKCSASLLLIRLICMLIGVFPNCSVTQNTDKIAWCRYWTACRSHCKTTTTKKEQKNQIRNEIPK